MDDRRQVSLFVGRRMRVAERADELLGDVPNRLVAELLFSTLEVLQKPLEVGAVDVLDDEHQALFELEEVEHPEDRRMVQARTNRRLTGQLFGKLVIALERVLDELELAETLEAHRPFHAAEIDVGLASPG
jgi:hypothetical protein